MLDPGQKPSSHNLVNHGFARIELFANRTKVWIVKKSILYSWQPLVRSLFNHDLTTNLMVLIFEYETSGDNHAKKMAPNRALQNLIFFWKSPENHLRNGIFCFFSHYFLLFKKHEVKTDFLFYWIFFFVSISNKSKSCVVDLLVTEQVHNIKLKLVWIR